CSFIFVRVCFTVFIFHDERRPELHTLSLHDALPIWDRAAVERARLRPPRASGRLADVYPARSRIRTERLALDNRTPRACAGAARDRKSTRLNSSHVAISYAVFCLKKKNTGASGDPLG